MALQALLPYLPAIIGAVQSIAGGGLMTGKRPRYGTPPALDQAIARANPDQDMPGFQDNLDRISLSSSNTIAAATDAGRVSDLAPIIQASESRAYNDAVQNNAEYKSRRLDTYLGLMKDKAQAQDTAFQINEFAPYAGKQGLGQAMIGAGIQNVTNSLDLVSMMSILDNAGKTTELNKEISKQITGGASIAGALAGLKGKKGGMLESAAIPTVLDENMPGLGIPNSVLDAAKGIDYKTLNLILKAL